MKRIEAWHTIHEMWGGATAEQKEALGIAMDDIEFVDLMRGHGVPLTNAQHIRSMTDEELAAELSVACRWCVYQPLRNCPHECEKGVLAWLRHSYKEDT